MVESAGAVLKRNDYRYPDLDMRRHCRRRDVEHVC